MVHPCSRRVAATSGFVLLIGLLAVVPCVRAQQDNSSPFAADGRAAQAWCRTPAAHAQCGWASADELSATTKVQVPFSGTVWTGPPVNLPTTLSRPAASYFQYAGRVVSLACRPGRLVVRTVFKVLPAPSAGESAGCTRLLWTEGLGTLGGNATTTARCDLVLPQHAPRDEAVAALRSREVNCRPCADCARCPKLAPGRWYSDTFYFAWRGCAALLKAGGVVEYAATTPTVLLNPNVRISLAKFEVQQA